MALTDTQRAAVFARDKGICAFSGLSLWILDYGTPVWHHDWPDHVRPVSRGGKDVLDNLVCASFFHNAKKLNNGADKAYLFLNGRPTEQFYWAHCELTSAQAEMLRRHTDIVESDWYFNRALSSVCIALDAAWKQANPVRDTDYWLRAAQKRLNIWRRIADETDSTSFVRRGLVPRPDAPDIQLMLAIATADNIKLQSIYRTLFRHYKANADVLLAFAAAHSIVQQKRILDRARKRQFVTKPLLEMLERNVQRLDPSIGRAIPRIVSG